MRRIYDVYSEKIFRPSYNVTATCENVKKIIEYLGISNRVLALLMGVTVQAVSAWKNGKYPPSGENIKFLSVLAGISIDDIYVYDMIEIKIG